jgi:hypothetical protein
MAKEAVPIILKNYIRENERGEKIFDFEQIVPVGDVPDWYDQRLEKWGTKWIGYDLNVSDTTIDFYTAWTPPIPIIRKLAEVEKFFVFRLEYYEVGMAFRGVVTARWQGSYVLLEDNSWDMTDKDLEELGLL